MKHIAAAPTIDYGEGRLKPTNKNGSGYSSAASLWGEIVRSGPRAREKSGIAV